LFATTTTPVHASAPWWVRLNSVPREALQSYADSGTPQWTLHAGRAVEKGHNPDPATPEGMDVIAGPMATPGVAIAAGHSGVWRREASGVWSRSLLLLPGGLLSGTPRITAVAAFDRPVSRTIYLATDGYGVLLTPDGGSTWIRDDLGLPGRVTGLVTNSARSELLAATDAGTWVHHLSALPAPPVYPAAGLLWRWIVIIALALASAAVGVLVLLRVCQ
jgi:hypothetical protein